jgi:4-amino-4-deoxy-L-arabinose transferase-like glycosyltransferase
MLKEIKTRISKSTFILCLILLTATLLRFYQLGLTPSGVTNDEASYIYNAYSIWHTGRDITGKFLPLSVNLDNSLSPVPIYIISPLVGIFGLSPLTGRLPFAATGVLTVLFLYLFTKELSGNKSIALISAFILAVSPWHIHFSRSAYEGILALFFFTAAGYVFIKKINSGQIYLSLPLFLLGFYSYHATKIFLIFWLIILFFGFKSQLLKKKSSLIYFGLGILTIFLSFIFVSRTQNVTRSDILLFNHSADASQMVNQERNHNNAPNILKQIFNNKITYYLRIIRENYLHAFSPDFLFLYGETSGLSGIYGTSFRGVMYLVDLPLFLMGIYFILKQKNPFRNIVLLSLLATPTPSAFSVDQSYGLRSIMMLPFLSICTGCGIFYLTTIFHKNRMFKAGAIILSVIYLYFISGYLYQYYFRYSIYGAQSWFRSSRDVVEYIDKVKSKYDSIQIVSTGGAILIQLAMFQKTDPLIIQKVYQNGMPKKIGNIYIINSCLDTHDKLFNPTDYLPARILHIVPDECYPKSFPYDTIRQVGEPIRIIWKIYKT